VIWLGEKRGNLSDWTTQQWVRVTGRHILLADHLWLDGPVGGTRQIGKQFFEDYAGTNQFEIVRSGTRGLIPGFHCLDEGNLSLAKVAQPVRDFYERTSEFDMDAWSDWCGAFKPFGGALSMLFSRRLQQLNVPLSPLDPSKGIASSVVQMRDPQTGSIVQTAWVRELHATGNVLYAGSYSICKVPGHPSPCIKVVFPLPNGNAIVVMKAVAHADGSLSVQSIGRGFGDPGFYFVVHDSNGMVWARYVRSLEEEIRVYAAENGTVRADHTLWLWGIKFLRLHYRMRRNQTPIAIQ
jgi:hypothetical protein